MTGKTTTRKRVHHAGREKAPEMISSRTFDGRIQLLECVPTVLAGPPAARDGQMARIAIAPRRVRYYDFGAGRMPRFLQELAKQNET